MLVNRADLLTCLQLVAPGLSATRETVEQSSCYIFRKGMVMTYNGNLACWVECPLGDMKSAVAAEPLRLLLEKLAEDELEINADEKELSVKGKGRRAGIRLETEITLPIKAVERPSEWWEVPADFGEAIDICIQCTAKDTSLGFYKGCIHLHPDHIEACDNFQMARYPLKTGVATPTLVKRDVIAVIKDLGMTQMAETPSWLHFTNPKGLIISCRRYVGDEANFPDLTNALKIQGNPTTLPAGLADAVDKAQVFTAGAEQEHVTVDIRPGMLRLTGRGAGGWYEEKRSVKYSGDPLSFLIAPKLLLDLTKRHTDCEIAPGRLKVDGGRFTYVTALAPVQAEKTNAGKPQAE